MTTAALPPLDTLFKRNAKRTRDIFASCPDDSMMDEERRCAMLYLREQTLELTTGIAAPGYDCLLN